MRVGMCAVVLLGLGACKKDGASGGGVWEGAAYDVLAGRHLEYTPAGLPNGVVLMLRKTDDGDWSMREGDDWQSGVSMGIHPVEVADGLWIDEQQVLPAKITVGALGEGVEVVEMGEWETWYGTFDDAVVVAIDGGVWEGEAAFGRGFGPLTFSFENVDWDLVYYEDLDASE
jgi:hypothetical protein